VNLDQLCVNTIRTLAMDGVQQANSGHPGTPMAMAPVAYTLWQRVLRFDPEDPIWPNRDRFVLSMDHASMLLYALLHLTGVEAVDSDYERLGELSVTLMTSSVSASPTASARGIRNTAGPRAWRPPRDPWARVWPPAWAWVRRSAEGDKHELGQDLTPR
jgi:transketolase